MLFIATVKSDLLRSYLRICRHIYKIQFNFNQKLSFMNACQDFQDNVK